MTYIFPVSDGLIEISQGVVWVVTCQLCSSVNTHVPDTLIGLQGGKKNYNASQGCIYSEEGGGGGGGGEGTGVPPA